MNTARGQEIALQAHDSLFSSFFLRRMVQFALSWKRLTRFEPLEQFFLDTKELNSGDLAQAKTILITSNHLGFWDPFFLEAAIHRLFPQHEFHPLMLEQEWQKRTWLSRLGVIPFQPKHAGSIKNLFRLLQSVRTDPTPRVFLIFPQGQFESHRADPTAHFQKGWMPIAQCFSECMILPVVLDYSHSGSDRVTPWLHWGTPRLYSEFGSAPHEELQAETTALFEKLHVLQEQKRMRARITQ